MNRNTSIATTISAKEFLDLTVQAAIDESHVVLKKVQDIESRFPNNVLGKGLWRSCVDYIDGIGFTLKEVLDHTLKPTPLDVQTWISAALNYITMCENGFELNKMTNSMLPTVTTNLTQLLLNSLAISVVIRGGNNNNTPGFVDWNYSTLLSDLAQEKADVVVAQDGSGDFKTIQEAVDSADSRRQSKRFVIYVKAGVYQEYVFIPKEVSYITVLGDGINKTIITGDRFLGTVNADTLQQTSTFQVWSRGFIARDITFQNTAGAEKHQAVAFLSGSDESAVYRCSIEGYQDTLYTTSYKQFYKECQIFGTVDFIFGNALAVFQDCETYFRTPVPHGGLVITAHGRQNENQSTGYSLQGCKIAAAEDLKPIMDQYKKSFLGRPWFPYARVVYMQSFLDDLVDPKGWLDSEQSDYSGTCYYGEYENNGPGSPTSDRVKWDGYHVITDGKIAEEFTVDNFIEGSNWLPETSVPFTAGLKTLTVEH
ncbi:pectinesterase-like [Rutidosis leptorrhynchoides]|uniref:pectinesterase-like n=1 Tax=Rutidosis leptorrhynchoides TaxID=125765 RepID=UPI003A99DE58